MSDKWLSYVIGIPGSGKTTAVNTVMEAAPVNGEERDPFAYTIYSGGVQLGANREGHSGTDALPYSVLPTVLEFLGDTEYDTIIAEGDRLANNSFFKGVIYRGWKLDLILLDTPDDIARIRCFKRRTKQSEIWRMGRATKVRKLANRWRRYLSVIDGAENADGVADKLRFSIGFQRLLNHDESLVS